MGNKKVNYSRFQQNLSKKRKALRILGVIAASVFIAETVVMFILPMLPPMPQQIEALVDSSILMLLLSPAFYFFLLRPVLRELEARTQAELRLEKSKTMLQTVFDGISDPLIYLDEDCIVKVLNTAACKYYGITRDEAVGQSCFKAFKGETTPCEECKIPTAVSGRESITTIERVSPFWPGAIEQLVIYRTSENRGSGGPIILRISDITKAKLMEKNMVQREKMASLGLLISSVAHEINNPNNFITFNLPILRDYIAELLPIADAHQRENGESEFFNMPYNEFREDLNRLIDNIENGAKRINRIVSQLKEFIQLGKRNEWQRVNPKSIVEKAVNICTGEINRKVSKFDVDIEDMLPEFITDPYAVEQILINLLINAAQASDKTDSYIRLQVKVLSDPEKQLLIRVSDNGCGMDTETQKHIFNPLFTTKEGTSGTGLGLYVCHTLIERLNGSIQVTSSLNIGSEFEILLPMPPRKTSEEADSEVETWQN